MATTTTFGLPANTEADPGDPLLSEHGTKAWNSIQSNREYLGASYTPEDDHNHDGVNSELVVLGAAVVNRAAIKSGLEQLSYVHVTSPHQTVSAWSSPGEYGFNTQLRVVNGNGFPITSTLLYQPYRSDTIGAGADTGYSPGFILTSTEPTGYTRTVWIQVRYVQASPPHTLLDDQDHGSWLYRVIRKSDEAVMASWCAGDPPYWLRGFEKYGERGKIHPGRFAWRAHPFVDDVPVWDPSEYEVRLYCMSDLNEVIEYLPARARLEKFQAEVSGLGVSAESAQQMEAILYEDAMREELSIQAVASELAALPSETEETISIVRNRRGLGGAERETMVEHVRRTAQKRTALLRNRLGRRRRIDVMDETNRIIDLQQYADACTRCVSDDRNHPGRKRLPGIYTDSTDSESLVRVMIQE